MEMVRPREKGPLILAVLALVLTGMALMASTMQALDRQRRAVDAHLLLAARSVNKAVAGALRPGMMPGMPGMAPFLFRPGAGEHLKEVVEEGNVLFVLALDQDGKPILTLAMEGAPEVKAPPGALEAMAREGEWHGSLHYGKSEAFVYGKRIRPRGFRRHMMGPGSGGERPDGPAGYLVVGLDTTEHRSVYRDARRNALLQAGFILGAALLVVILALGLVRRRAASARADTLERFQSRLLDNLPDGLLTIGPARTIQAANPAAHRILGAEPGELAGRPCDRLPLEIPRGRGADWVHVELEGRRLEVLAVPFAGQEGEEHRLVLLRDRTEMRRLEEDLDEARRLAAVGALAAGVAHEIRNPLSSLRGFAQYFAKKLAGVQPDEEYARTMVRESDRLDRVVSDLLFLARPRPPRPEPVDLAALAREIGALLGLDLGRKGVRLDTDIRAPQALADPDGVKQALLNLVLNSLQALDEQAADPVITVSSRAVEGGVEVAVADNGPGMGAEERARAFDPFYTGRPSGTGLGLAIVHKTMRDLGGKAVIESEPGRGAAVRLFFPEGDGPEEESLSGPLPASPS